MHKFAFKNAAAPKCSALVCAPPDVHLKPAAQINLWLLLLEGGSQISPRGQTLNGPAHPSPAGFKEALSSRFMAAGEGVQQTLARLLCRFSSKAKMHLGNFPPAAALPNVFEPRGRSCRLQNKACDANAGDKIKDKSKGIVSSISGE